MFGEAIILIQRSYLVVQSHERIQEEESMHADLMRSLSNARLANSRIRCFTRLITTPRRRSEGRLPAKAVLSTAALKGKPGGHGGAREDSRPPLGGNGDAPGEDGRGRRVRGGRLDQGESWSTGLRVTPGRRHWESLASPHDHRSNEPATKEQTRTSEEDEA
ncbi:hypothetical protein NL676_010907 [Syzygium grande]|nr:hypothetical protein NL676_010907 [Syzygium grande]